MTAATCQQAVEGVGNSVAASLHGVDCAAGQMAEAAFGRLFGTHGALLPALTILLTIYVALFALALITGRSRIGINSMTSRLVTMGLVLTFATSWIAYQSVVWNLATGAPDEIASVLVGSKGSATMLFAQQLDGVFAAITDAAGAIPANPAVAAATPSLASAANILSIAGLLLLLGTVGVLVVCRLALAALLIIGPVFIVLALFEGTRGLFEGWLKSVAMFAFVPLLTVVMGSGALVAIAPMVAALGQDGAQISLHTAVSILVAAIIYLSLMLVVFKVASMLTRSWRLGRSTGQQAANASAVTPAHQERPLSAAP